MEAQQPQKGSSKPAIQVLTDVRTRLRRAAEHGLSAQAILGELRERMLNALLIAGLAIGLAVYLVNLPSTIAEARWILLAISSAALAGLLVVTLLRRIPIMLRAGVMLSLVYLAGLNALLREGLYGNGSLYLMGFAVLAVLLVGLRSRAAALALSLGTLIVVGLLMVTGSLPAPSLAPGEGNASPVTWTIAALHFTLLALTLTISLGYFLREVEISLQKQQYLAEDLERERLMLANRVSQRTQDVERRLLQIRTAAEINRTISTQLNLGELLPAVCELIKARFELYYVGVFLIQELPLTIDNAAMPGGQKMGRYAVLAAGSGEAGRQMLAEGHKLAVAGDSMIGWACTYRQARIALDVGLEAVRFSNPHLPLTRSELALPMLVQDQVMGAITIQSEKAEAFDQDDIVILQSIADSLGGAIVNARLLSEVQANLEEIQTLHSQYLRRAWSEVVQSRGELAYTYQAPIVIEASGNERSLQVPIRLRDEVIGSMTLEAEGSVAASGVSPSWTPEELALIENIADQAALALENARLLDETQQRAEQERLRASLSTKVWSSTDVENILRTALLELGSSLGAVEGYIQLEVEE